MINLNSVLFPAPFGPIIPTIPPGGKEKDKLSNKILSSKCIPKFFTSITLDPSLSPLGIIICALFCLTLSEELTSSSYDLILAFCLA